MRLQLLFIVLALTVVASVSVLRVAQEVELLNVPCGSVLHSLPEGTSVSKVGASRLARCDGMWEAQNWLRVEYQNVQGWISEEEANGLVRDDRNNGDGDGGDGSNNNNNGDGNQGDGNQGDGNNNGDGNQGDGNNGDGNNNTPQINTAALIQFADTNWNCAQAACTSKVSAGSGQSNYQCAEFVSRCLSAAGYIPNLTPGASQSAYLNYQYQGVTYDLLWVSSKQGPPKGLEDFLIVLGWKNVGTNPSLIVPGSAVMCVGAEGAYSHVAVGIGKNMVDAHNNARFHEPGSFYQINAIYNPPS
jgi:hypothetical protein